MPPTGLAPVVANVEVPSKPECQPRVNCYGCIPVLFMLVFIRF